MTDRPATSALPPVHAALRFALEVGALVCWGVVGWSVADGLLRWVLVVALPVAGGAAWAVFRTPGDESAGGTAPVPVAGGVRLGLELGLLLGGAALCIAVGRPVLGGALAVGVVVHLATTVGRTRWLLAQHPAGRA